MRNYIVFLPLLLFTLPPDAAGAMSDILYSRGEINLPGETRVQLKKQSTHNVPFINNADFELLSPHFQRFHSDTVITRPEDVSSIDGIIKAMYDVISGPAGERDWERQALLFKPDAKLSALGKNEDGKLMYITMTLEDYRRRNESFFMENDFWEEEIGREVFRFGEIATVQTAYRFRMGNNNEKPHRGVNSVQLVYDQGRWWITNITWNSEREDNPIPEKLLK